MRNQRKYWRDYAAKWKRENPDRLKAIRDRYWSKNKAQILEKKKQWRKAHPIASAQLERAAHLYKTYKLRMEDYNNILRGQRGRCAICKRLPKKNKLSVDHKGLKIRGLLCARCNRGVGLFWDDPQILRAAATYLELTVR